MKVLDLFSGIGGFSLGLEKAGFETVAFCEIDAKARMVLKKHWPDIPIFEDIRELNYEKLQSIGLDIDVICGGFPCQDISVAGKGAGLDGERSGLWFEYHRLIKEIKPKYAIIENVSALRSRGLEEVLWSLNEIGYDAEWHCIPASAIGAPHRRDRVWIVAYPRCSGWREQPTRHTESIGSGSSEKAIGSANTGTLTGSSSGAEIVAYPKSERIQGLWSSGEQESHAYVQKELLMRLSERFRETYWKTESGLDRVVDGIPNRMDRIKQLGNSVVPQIPELIGIAIMESENGKK